MDSSRALDGSGEIYKVPESDASVSLNSNLQLLPETKPQHEQSRLVSSSDGKSDESIPTGSTDVSSEAHPLVPVETEPVSDPLIEGSRKRKVEETATDGCTLQDRVEGPLAPGPPTAASTGSPRTSSIADPPIEAPAKKSRMEDISNMALLLEASASAQPIAIKPGENGSSSQPLPASAEPGISGPGGLGPPSPAKQARLGVDGSDDPASDVLGETTISGMSALSGLEPELSSSSNGPAPEVASVRAGTGLQHMLPTHNPNASKVVSTKVEIAPTPGIFDDADSDGESGTPLAGKPKPAKAAPSPKGGIFDDASDDDSFELPSYALPSATMIEIQPRIPGVSKVDIDRQPSTTILPKPSVLPPPAAPVVPASKNGEDKKNAPKKKKKKPTKPTKRVLVARKEKDAAALAVKGKTDLVGILATDHCQFLGKELWIFTVEQLECILKSTESSIPPKSKNCLRREELVEKVAKSLLVASDNVPTSEGNEEKSEAQDASDSNANPQSLVKEQSEAKDATGSDTPAQSLTKKIAETNDRKDDDATPQPDSNATPRSLAKEQSEAKDATGSDTPAQSLTKEIAETNDRKEDDATPQPSSTQEIGKKEVENVSLTTNEPSSEGSHIEPATADDNGSNVAEDALDGNGAVLTNEKVENSAAAGVLPSKELHEKAKKRASETLLQSWQAKIESWRTSDKSDQNVLPEKKFLLTGPISCLFPTFSLRFFASVPVLSLYEFLCLKKTETGAIIALCGAWRKQCGLVNASPLSLAKHFLGMGLRAETAIAASLPPDANTRKWLSDPIVVLTGAAKEFAIEALRIYSAVVFVETRTKDLANQLVEWRTRRGLPPLKGSGKVAMISGWKANVKEAIDLEVGEGRVLVGVNLQALVEQSEAVPIVNEEKKKMPQPAKQAPQQEFTFDPRIPDVEAALQSTKFLQEVLEPKHFAALQEAGIKTADELFSAQKIIGSPLALALSKILPDPSTFELVIFDWCQVVRKKLSGIRRVHSKRKDPPEQPPDAEPKAKKERPSEPRPVAPRPSKTELLQKDPFFSLSSVTQTFLGTVGIQTAEAFLSSRTTDLSSAFVVYREKHNMSVLKGLGAIASVSGWKAQMRKIARDRGLHGLAETTPGGPPGSPIRKPKPAAKQPKLNATSTYESKLVGASKERITRPDVLFGRPTHRVVVESTRDPRLRFFFELSIRKKPSGVGLFLTYVGAKKLQALGRSSFSTPCRHINVSDGVDGDSKLSLPVVKDISKGVKRGIHSSSTPGKDVRVHFSSLEDGGGLIEISKHHVGPLPYQGEVEAVYPSVVAFINGSGEGGVLPTNQSYSSNIVVGKDQNGKAQYFLFLKERMEKGQTVELRFCGPSDGKENCYEVAADGQWRSFIDGTMSRLSGEGLRSLLVEVTQLVSDKIDKKLWNSVGEGDAENCDAPSDREADCSAGGKLVLSRRRAHWVASRIMYGLQEIQMRKNASQDDGASFMKSFVESHSAVLWTPKLVSKLKEHPLWGGPLIDVIKKEAQEELDNAIECHAFLNAPNRQRWCKAGVDLFHQILKLIPRFSTLLDDCSPQQAIVEIQQLATEFAKELISVQGDSSKDLERLLMTFEEDNAVFKDSSPSPGYTFHTSVAQAYNDALALCGSPGFDIPVPKVQVRRMFAASAPSGRTDGETGGAESRSVEALFRTADDVKGGLAHINIGWYTRFQILLPVYSLLSCSFVVLENEQPFKAIAMRGVEAALTAAGVVAGSWAGETRRSALGGAPVTPLPSNLNPSVYEPRSLPLFLRLIWPALRSSHWRMEAGESPSDVYFYPPGQRGRRGDKRTKVQKHERTRSRIKIAKASNEVGLGFVPKLSKRLLASASSTKALELKHVRESAKIASVGDALERFVATLVSDVSDVDEETRKRAEQVVDYVRVSFDELFPNLLSDEAKEEYELAGAVRPSDTAGCEYLARYLLVLPSIMVGQAGLSMQLVEDTTVVIKELVDFLASNHVDLFDARFHPPMEIYVGERKVPAVLASRLENLRSAGDDSCSSDMIAEAILPEDRPDLTDFVGLVMSQVVPCRASEKDVERKNRRIGLGRVGLMCRHCMGARGEGRYFFMSVESITTAATVIEKHIQKCPEIPTDTKKNMVACRSRHGDQRRSLSPGAQASFFLRLWERLRSSKVKDTAAALQILEMNEKEESEDEDGSTGVEFESHARLIDYLSKTLPWRENPGVVQALDRYYECLEFGSRLHLSHAKPKGFTSEWVLAQMSATESKDASP